MANDKLLLNDGSSFVLLNDGTSVVLLNSEVGVGGLTLSGTHAGVALIGPRPEQLIPTEFTFRLKSCLITNTGFRICVKSTLEVLTKINTKLKSLLIVETHKNIKIKANRTVKTDGYKIELKSTIWAKPMARTGLFSNTEKSKKNKVKELLLRRLREMMEDE